MNKQIEWRVRKKVDQHLTNSFPEIEESILQLLFNRGLKDQASIDRFLGPDYMADQRNPFDFKQMDKAVKLIQKSIDKNKKIFVYGDYDADGVTATSVVYLTLKKLGAKKVEVYIPDRLKEGYGINSGAVEYIQQAGADFIITVDCGISNAKEIDLARSLGMQVVVTDHHLTSESIPKAEAIICPTVEGESYGFKHLAGVGVAFKLAQALLQKADGNFEAFEKWLLDLVALGTVADCVPLLGENRTLTKWGLIVLNKTHRQGLLELIRVAAIKKDIDSRAIGFQLAPRINSAGRMDHANAAFELLVTSNEVEALAIANDLNKKNNERQKVTEEMLKISLEQVGEPTEQDKVLFSQYDGWSPGLVGLVAGKLSERFYRPVIVLGKTGDTYIGSGRSIEEFNITQALQANKKYLEEYGGHSQACGLTIKGDKNLKKFKQAMQEFAQAKLAQVELRPFVDIEAEIELEKVNWDLVEAIDKFKPFGEDNPEPVFVSRNLEVDSLTTMGSRGQHLRVMLYDRQTGLKKFIAFNGVAAGYKNLQKGDIVDVVYYVGVNEWNGNKEIELKVKDIKSINN